MSPWKRWRRRGVLLAGVGLAGVTLRNLSKHGAKRTTESKPFEPSTASTAISSEFKGPLRLGWTDWDDARVVSKMVAQLIETQFQLPVELIKADIGIQYESLARGDLELMVMAWLPMTHRGYWEKQWKRVLDLGPMYTGKLGWIVPDYVPESALNSVEQLQDPAIANQFSNRVQGIEPGSGLNQASLKALQAYGLPDLELVASSSAAMAAVVAKAIADQRWLIATSWTPHWMFARYGLRFLDDPKGVFGGTERIHALARFGLDRQAPEITAFLSRFQLPEQDLDALLLEVEESSADEAVKRYLVAHPERVRYWVTGQI